MTERFFIIGGQRCGTTYLRGLLAGSRDVGMAPGRPESKLFFGDVTADDLARYEATFPAGKRVLGDKTAGYLEDPTVARRMAAVYPDAKLIAVLREPVARALSNYRYSRDEGVETLPLADAMTATAQWRPHDPTMARSPFLYLERGRYGQMLRPFLRLFPGRVLVVDFNELISSPAGLARVCAFLDISPPPWAADPVNASAGLDAHEAFDTIRRLGRLFEPENGDLVALLGAAAPAWSLSRGPLGLGAIPNDRTRTNGTQNEGSDDIGGPAVGSTDGARL